VNVIEAEIRRRQADYRREAQINEASRAHDEDGPGWRALRACDVRPSAVRFAYEGRVPVGAVTAFVGEPGKAKSTVCVELLARASRAQLRGDLDGPCNSLYLTAEDSPEHTLVPRLIAAGADLERVSFFTVRRDGVDEGMTLPDDLPALRAAIEKTGAQVVVVDPLMAHLSGAVDSHRDHDIRRVLAPLARLADELGIAIIVVAHLNKSEAADVFRRVGGSIGLTAAVRSILVLADDPEEPNDDTARVLVHAKSNLAKVQQTLKLRVEGRDVTADDATFSTAGITWCGDSTVTAADIFGRQNEPRPAPSRDAAAEYLEELLGDRLVPVSEVKAEIPADISWRSVERAKGDLGVVAEQVRDGSGQRVSGWTWRLPSTPPPTPPLPKGPPGGGLENGPKTVAVQSKGRDGNGSNLYTATSPRVATDLADYPPAEVCEQCSVPDARLTIHGRLCPDCFTRVAKAVPGATRPDDNARTLAQRLDAQEATWNR
jgi:hypothetical protein